MALRIITRPTVYLIGSQAVDEIRLQDFLDAEGVGDWSTDSTNAPEMLPEIAGRVCYMSFAKPRPGGNAAYLKHILEVGHGSVLEHAVFNFLITGVSRSLTHELVRHRVGFSYSQLSQRYVSDVAFVVPPIIRVKGVTIDPKSYQASQFESLRDYSDFGIWLSGMTDALHTYEGLCESFAQRLAHVANPTARHKQAREAARSALPNATETKIFITANARALRHFLELRGSLGADAEIRRVALAMLAILQAEAPNLFGDYTITNGEIQTPYRKV